MKNEDVKEFKRIVFSDVDGTIYPFPNKNLHPKTKEYLETLREKFDTEFIINTGNPPFEKIKRLARTLNCRYLVTCGGSTTYDILENKYLNVIYMDKKEAQKVLDIAKKKNAKMYWFGVDNFYTFNADEEMKKFLVSFFEYDNWIETNKIPNDLNKMEFYGDANEIKNIYEVLSKENIKLKIINLNSHIEITPFNIDKSSGIKWYCDNYFNVDINRVMAIGDSQNDIAMLKAVGHSYAMANSDLETMSYAKHYTSSVEQLGLIEAINDYIYRTKFDYELFEKTKKLNRKGK